MNQETFPMAEAVRAAYRAGEEDEAMLPRVLVDERGRPVGRFQDGDYVIFYNIRGEREVELSEALTDPGFAHFAVEPIRLHMATMIQYHPALNVRVAFPPVEQITGTLCETIAAAGRRHVRICESEKAVHVGFFLGGKRNEPFAGEHRVVVPSPEVDDYATVPELNAFGVAAATIKHLRDPGWDVIITNLANCDVIGHLENEEAILTAIHTVDTCIGRIVAEARKAGVVTVLTADHGTVERWLYPDGAVDTGHTDSPVPFVLVEPDAGPAGRIGLREGGDLTDVAPTVLERLGIARPELMTGRSLLQGNVPDPAKRLLLLILDGWGHNGDAYGNLIRKADTPVMDRLLGECPWTTLVASGPRVGMPVGSVGNSETGHLHIGAGRVIAADRVRIDRAIADGSFFENEAWLWAMRGAKRDRTRLHLLGIVSFYSSHGSVDHLFALLELAKRQGVQEVYIHSMLGRRGERPESGAIYIGKVERKARELGVGRVVGVIGRFWSLDREHNWDRIEKTYRWLVHGEGVPVRA